MKYRNLLISIFSILISAFSAGAAMNVTSPTQLGKDPVGVVARSTFKEMSNDPRPIVLWSRGSYAAVLRYSNKTNAVTGNFTQRIEKIATHGAANARGAWFDDYPITFTGHAFEEKDLRRLDAIMPDQIFTADIDGDGTDEMVLVSRHGGVGAYNDRKRLFQQPLPSARPDLYEYEVQNAFKASLKGRDVLFLIINRRSHEDSSYFSKADQEFDRQTRPYMLMRVDRNGVAQLSLESPGWTVEEMLTLGVLNRPGSTDIDEIVVCSRRLDDQALYLCRYNPAGALEGEPRKIYVEVPDEKSLRFLPVLQSAQMAAYNPSTKQLYFVWPEKKVNWIRRVDLTGRLKNEYDVDLLSVFQYGARLLAAVRSEADVYVLDEEGLFHTWKDDRLTAGKDRRAAFHLPLESDLHAIVDVQPAGGGAVAFAMTQSRPPQTRKPSEKDLVAAARRFLSKEELADCQEDQEVTFDEDLAELAAIHCEENKLTCPVFTSLDEIENAIPAFYEKQVAMAREDYLNCLKISLLDPIERTDGTSGEIDVGDVKDKETYKAWLKGLYIDAQTVFTLIDLQGRTISRHSIDGLFKDPQELMMTVLLSLPGVSYHQAHDGPQRHHVVTALTSKPMGASATTRYYHIAW